jgi:Ni/Fe-hydrogenase subunit HybB-like protein
LDGPAADPAEESIGALFGRLAEDGRAYAQAELELVKAIARHRAARARGAAIALAAGAFLLISSMTALVIGVVMGLSLYMSPFLAGLIVAAAMAGIGYVLVRKGVAGMQTLGRDTAEQQALDKGARA